MQTLEELNLWLQFSRKFSLVYRQIATAMHLHQYSMKMNALLEYFLIEMSLVDDGFECMREAFLADKSSHLNFDCALPGNPITSQPEDSSTDQVQNTSQSPSSKFKKTMTTSHPLPSTKKKTLSKMHHSKSKKSPWRAISLGIHSNESMKKQNF
jgi:hypothetical protein